MADPITVSLVTLGWRERLALPQLGMGLLKAQLDTGARGRALHVDTRETIKRDGETWLRFDSHDGRQLLNVSGEASALDRRVVTDISGRRTGRWFIRNHVLRVGPFLEIDIKLTNRRHMLFTLWPGRTVQRGRFTLDPSLSRIQSRPLSPVADLA